jgi:hypothetical protein
MIDPNTPPRRSAPRGMTLAAVALVCLPACTLDTDLERWDEPDAAADATPGAPDAASSADADAPEPDASLLLTVVPGLTTTYFADGRSLSAGDYTLVYVDGCWRSGVVAWTVNLGGEGYWVVGGQPEQRLKMAPGSVGTFAGGLGAYATYAECIATNVGRPGITFHFDGGPLGLKLESLDPITLTIGIQGGESEGGRSPTFRLTCVGGCP